MALRAHRWEGTLSHLPNEPITGKDSDEARQWIDVHHVYCLEKSVWLPCASTGLLLFLANLEKCSPGRFCPTQYNLASAGRWQLKLAAMNEFKMLSSIVARFNLADFHLPSYTTRVRLTLVSLKLKVCLPHNMVCCDLRFEPILPKLLQFLIKCAHLKAALTRG